MKMMMMMMMNNMEFIHMPVNMARTWFLVQFVEL